MLFKRLGMFGVLAAGMLIGCAGRPSLFPNTDPALRKTAAQFAADAAMRHPYKADAPRGGDAQARAHVGYTADHIQIVNTSEEDWTDVEIWVNQTWVVHVPKLEKKVLKTIPFMMLYDAEGNYFPTDNSKTIVNKLEILRDGKMWDVVCHVAD